VCENPALFALLSTATVIGAVFRAVWCVFGIVITEYQMKIAELFVKIWLPSVSFGDMHEETFEKFEITTVESQARGNTSDITNSHSLSNLLSYNII
jgi:hypothetical protein